jgi:hypothetical protein
MSTTHRTRPTRLLHSRIPNLHKALHTALIAAIGLGLAGAVVRGASGTRKFWEQRNAMSREFQAQQRELGLAGGANRAALYKQYPTPEIALCKPVLLAPGATATVSFGGKFAEKTRFLAGNDQVELAEGAVVAGKFTAKATASADALPGFAPIYAFTPVSGAFNACHALFVGPVIAYDLKGDNGWIIKLTPEAKAFTVKDREAVLPYLVSFFKPGEAAPFKKMSSDFTVRQDDEPGKEPSLSLTAHAGDGSPEAELAAIQKKMMDVQAYLKMSPKEQDRLSKRLTELTEQQMKTLMDPAAQQKAQQEQDDFGCSSLSFQVRDGAVRGWANCGKNVGTRGRVTLSGAPVTAAPTAPAAAQ